MTRTRWGSLRIVARRRIGSAAGEANQLPAALSGGDVTGPTPNCLSHVVTCLRESATGAAAMKIVACEEPAGLRSGETRVERTKSSDDMPLDGVCRHQGSAMILLGKQTKQMLTSLWRWKGDGRDVI